MNIKPLSSMSAKEASDGMEIIATIILPFIVILCMSALAAFAVSAMSDHNTTAVAVTMIASTILLSSLYFGLLQLPIVAAFKKKETETGESACMVCSGKVMNGNNDDAENSDTEEQVSSSLTDEDKSAIYSHGEEVFKDITAKERQDRLDQIEEYLYHTMSPFVAIEDMPGFCDKILFYVNNPETEPTAWERSFIQPEDGKPLTNFDIRHVLWSIVIRIGYGKNFAFNSYKCAHFIKVTFPQLCREIDESSLRNMKVQAANGDNIDCDEPNGKSFSFHIPRKHRTNQ